MKCVRCGAEIPEGNLYCPNCGHEVQIVPEYNVHEDDLLRHFLTSEEPAVIRRRRRILVPIFIVVVLIAIIFTAVYFTRLNSFSRQFQLGVNAAAIDDVENGRIYLLRALSSADRSGLQEEQIQARLELGKVYLSGATNRENEDKAISLFQEVIEMEPENLAAYQNLINLYREKNDIATILAMKESAPNNPSIHLLFAEWNVSPPVFEPEPGTFEEATSIEIVSVEGFEIYFTTDGSDPIEEGELYSRAFRLRQESTLSIRAVAKNEAGVFSEEIDGDFILVFQQPDPPEISPRGGSFTTPVLISINTPPGTNAYYTWDGSDPTIHSTLYLAPFEVIEGNNVLSVIIVRNGIASRAVKWNFRYVPAL